LRERERESPAAQRWEVRAFFCFCRDAEKKTEPYPDLLPRTRERE